jgi:hypothetical protein
MQHRHTPLLRAYKNVQATESLQKCTSYRVLLRAYKIVQATESFELQNAQATGSFEPHKPLTHALAAPPHTFSNNQFSSSLLNRLIFGGGLI